MALPVPLEKVIDLSKPTVMREVRCTCNKLLFKVEDSHGISVIATVCPRCYRAINITIRGPADNRV